MNRVTYYLTVNCKTAAGNVIRYADYLQTVYANHLDIFKAEIAMNSELRGLELCELHCKAVDVYTSLDMVDSDNSRDQYKDDWYKVLDVVTYAKVGVIEDVL